MTTREAIAIVRDFAPTVTDCEKLHAALLVVSAVAEHNHARRTRRKRERRERKCAAAFEHKRWRGKKMADRVTDYCEKQMKKGTST